MIRAAVGENFFFFQKNVCHQLFVLCGGGNLNVVTPIWKPYGRRCVKDASSMVADTHGKCLLCTHYDVHKMKHGDESFQLTYVYCINSNSYMLLHVFIQVGAAEIEMRE